MPSFASDSPSPHHWLITSPRSASNLFIKILNLDEQNVRPAKYGGYFFLQVFMERNKIMHRPLETWTGKEMKTVLQGHQEGYDSLQDYIAASKEAGQIVFVKEHAYMVSEPIIENMMNFPGTSQDEEPTMVVARQFAKETRSEFNKTILPDEFLKTWHPTFLIRHPALLFPSLLRSMSDAAAMPTPKEGEYDIFNSQMTLFWQRNLFDFYTQHFDAQRSNGEKAANGAASETRWPVLLDADDIMLHPSIVTQYAKLVGLDPDKLVFEWQAVSKDELKNLDPREQRFRDTLNASSGVNKDKVAGNIDIATEAEKWRAEFGPGLGGALENWVRKAMPDYEHMKARRLRPE